MPAQTVLVAGPALNVETRSGTSRASGEPYSITTVRVLVESTGVAEITLPRTIPAPGQGEDVAYIAEADIYRDTVQLRAVRAVSLARV